jgi:hypothetical protein
MVATTVRRLAAAIVIAAFCALSFSGDVTALFQYHPMLMAVSFIGFLPELMYLGRVARRATGKAQRNEAAQAHLLAASLMKILSLLGFAVIFQVKKNYGKEHFTSLHGQIGVATVVLIGVQALAGFALYWQAFGVKMLKWQKLAHKWFGIAVAGLGCWSMVLGMLSGFGVNLAQGALHTAFCASTVVLVAVAYLFE